MRNLSRRHFIEIMAYSLIGNLMVPKKVLACSEKPLTKKIIKVESSGNPDAYREDTQARGLMQITPIVLKEWNSRKKPTYEPENLFNAGVNVKVGEWYLYNRIKGVYLPYYKLSPSLENMLAAWNMGPTELGKLGDAKENYEQLPKQTQEFIKKVKRS